MREEDSNADLKVMLAAVFLLVIAAACFGLRNVLPEFAATSARATTVLAVKGEHDEAGLRHVFESVRPAGSAMGLEASSGQERGMRLWVEAATEAGALKSLEQTVDALRKAHAAQGGGELQMIVSEQAVPVPNPSMERLALLMRGAFLVLLLAGTGLLYLVRQKRRAGMVKP